MTLTATKPMSLFQKGPRVPHIVTATRGKSGEIQQVREDLEYSDLMKAGELDAPVITYADTPEFDHTGPTTYNVYGRGFLQPGWEQARVTTALGVANADIEWIAVEPGLDGNDLTVEYVDGGMGFVTDVTYAAGVVTVTFDDGAGTVDAAAVLAALALSTDAQYVVMARHKFASTGAGVITPMTAISLSDGRGSAMRRAFLARGAVADSQLIWVARKPGAEGELVSVTYRTGLAASLLPVITVTGHDIDVYLRAAATTANDILRALEASQEARNLVEVFLAYDNDGTGLPGALAVAHLDNGDDGSAVRIEVGGADCDISRITDGRITFVAPTLGAFAADVAVPVTIDICGYVTRLQGITI